ncbi:hypothetical protein CON64_18480 [Bacillus pseudomycoides]|nr:hypothetical protein CON64_18480 [Bacillus pseudomycoides]
MEITLQNIQEAMETQPELVEGLAKSFLTSEKVGTFLDTEEGKKIVQPKLDSHFSKSLDTWKNNNLQRIINEEVTKRNPSETAEQKAMREMEQRLNQMDKERQMSEMKTLGIQLASERKLPSALVPFMVTDTDSQTRSNIDTLELEFKSAVERAVEERLKSAGTTPPQVNTSTTGLQAGSQKFSEMSFAERNALHRSNPKLYAQLKAQD